MLTELFAATKVFFPKFRGLLTDVAFSVDFQSFLKKIPGISRRVEVVVVVVNRK